MRVRNDLLDRINRDEYRCTIINTNENDLAKIYGTTRLTVRNALDGLVEQGSFVEYGTRRICVQPTGRSGGVGGVRRDFASMRLGGFRSVGRVYQQQSKLTAGKLASGACSESKPDDLLYCVRRLNSVNGTPVAIENTLVPMPLFP
ncbi:MAG: hypothetical protein ACLTSX_02360 [Collinsella sp.]